MSTDEMIDLLSKHPTGWFYHESGYDHHDWSSFGHYWSS